MRSQGMVSVYYCDVCEYVSGEYAIVFVGPRALAAFIEFVIKKEDMGLVLPDSLRVHTRDLVYATLTSDAMRVMQPVLEVLYYRADSVSMLLSEAEDQEFAALCVANPDLFLADPKGYFELWLDLHKSSTDGIHYSRCR